MSYGLWVIGDKLMSERIDSKTKVKELAFEFAVALTTFLKTVPSTTVERELVRQLIRSGTSIGANVEEAAGARTRREFINSMNIAKREARETVYWLRIINATQSNGHHDLGQLISTAESLSRILTAIVKTSESNPSPITRNL